MFIADVTALTAESITLSFWTGEHQELKLSPEQLEPIAAAYARAKANPDALRTYFEILIHRNEAMLDLIKDGEPSTGPDSPVPSLPHDLG